MSARIGTYLIAVALASSACNTEHPPARLAIVVVGSGASDLIGVRERFHLNRAQGAAMWKGAKLAFNKSTVFDSLRDVLELRGEDDGGYEDLAERDARRFEHDPSVLAVIGHATSSTTRVAVPHYSASGIPLLMPIATSPTAALVHGRRAPFAFRLPPSDDLFQAPAIALVVESLPPRDSLHPQRVFLVADTSPGAGSYSKTLFEAVDGLLAGKVVERGSVARATGSISSTTFSALAQKPDVIVFCGYGTTAQEFFLALRREYASVDSAHRPRVVLSDGSWIEDLDTHGFETYITFPVAQVDPSRSRDALLLARDADANNRQSYEVLGYDAMLLLGAAASNCRHTGDLSRSCIRAYLASTPELRGAQSTYSFNNGENESTSYHIYRSVGQDTMNDVTVFALSRTLSAAALKDRRRSPTGPGEN